MLALHPRDTFVLVMYVWSTDSSTHLQVYLDCVICVLAFSLASSGREFDPRTRAFSDEELKPQPMIKKSRKQVLDSYKPVYVYSITNHNCICTAALNRILQCCIREEWRFLWQLSFLNTFVVDIPTQWPTQEFCSGGGSTNYVEDRENRDLGAVAP